MESKGYEYDVIPNDDTEEKDEAESVLTLCYASQERFEAVYGIKYEFRKLVVG